MTLDTNELRRAFKTRLCDNRIIVAPGVYDTLSAYLAAEAGFEAVFFSGSAYSYSQFARPDIGLATMTELSEAVARAADRISIPIVADVDSGFGSLPHVARMVRLFECAGAAAIQMEDQVPVKPAHALLSRPLVPVGEMVDRLSAVQDARQSEDMLVSARTDAKDVNEAIERCAAYCEAGADLIFAESLTSASDLQKLRNSVGEIIPIVYNNIYPDGDATDAQSLQNLGVNVVLFPGVGVQNAAAALRDSFARLYADPSLGDGARSPLSGAALNKLLDSSGYLQAFEMRSQKPKKP